MYSHPDAAFLETETRTLDARERPIEVVIVIEAGETSTEIDAFTWSDDRLVLLTRDMDGDGVLGVGDSSSTFTYDCE